MLSDRSSDIVSDNLSDSLPSRSSDILSDTPETLSNILSDTSPQMVRHGTVEVRTEHSTHTIVVDVRQGTLS